MRTDKLSESGALLHPTAIIDRRAELASDVRVGPYTIIGPHVRIDEGTEIKGHVVLEGNLRVGKRNRIFTGAVLGTPPQDLKYRGEVCSAIIGNDTTIREYVSLNVATTPDGMTRVGDHCLLMTYAHIAHNCSIGNHVIIANATQLGGHVHIADWAIVGGVVGVHQFSVVGAHAFVGGASRLVVDVPPFVRAAGSPVRAGGINSMGLRRRDFSEERIAVIKELYRALYRRGLPIEEAKKRIRECGDEFIAQAFEDFFSRSHRGICR